MGPQHLATILKAMEKVVTQDPCASQLYQTQVPLSRKIAQNGKSISSFFITYLRIKPTYGCFLSLVQKTLSLASTYD